MPELRPLPVYGYEIQKWLEISHTELWADVLYNYLDDILHFPFSARCVTRRATSPLKPGDKVKVVGMAPAEECEHDMFVMIQWKGDQLAVPLMQLEGVQVDEETQQAIEDWRYWVDRGYEL